MSANVRSRVVYDSLIVAKFRGNESMARPVDNDDNALHCIAACRRTIELLGVRACRRLLYTYIGIYAQDFSIKTFRRAGFREAAHLIGFVIAGDT